MSFGDRQVWKPGREERCPSERGCERAEEVGEGVLGVTGKGPNNRKRKKGRSARAQNLGRGGLLAEERLRA